MTRPPLAEVVQALARAHGRPALPPSREPFGLVLWENVAYLVDDAKRGRAFAALREQVGLEPAAILQASAETLRAVAALGGPLAAGRIVKLRRCAIAALELGDLAAVVQRPLREAVKALKRFPSLGEAGAERVLLLCGAHPVLALDSNGLRVLLRLGFGGELGRYAATYRAVQKDAASELPARCTALARAYALLRRHGQEVCRRTAPACASCCLRAGCAFPLRR